MKEIEQALLKGDNVTTQELKKARAHFSNLRFALLELGPHWHFAFVEANRLEMMTASYLRAREQ
ncbi:MAG: hypothetical protein AB7L09_00180 [Nitrospira sp.]